MAAIDGLTEDQCEDLARAQVGDLILIERHPKDAEYDELESVSEAEAEDEENENAMDSDDGESEDVAGGSGDDADDEATDDEANDDVDADVEDAEETPVGDNGDSDAISPTVLCVVQHITVGEDNTVTDIVVCVLPYHSAPAQVDGTGYHVYGRDVQINTKYVAAMDETSRPITGLVSDEDFEYELILKPSGDDVRDIVFQGVCPAGCRRGWVRSQEEMHGMVTETITTLAAHSPVCPVCMGKALMQEYQSLREMLEVYHSVDVGLIVEFFGRLNPRRRQLGYAFEQFDEREWGMLFDDMLSDDEDGAGADSDRFEHWDEAMDPNSHIMLRPASNDAITALPRKLFADYQKTEDDMECVVCQEKFRDDVVIVELPCGHIFCDAGCVEQWLKQFNSCPTCRVKLPAKDEEDVEAAVGSTNGLTNGDVQSHETNEIVSGEDEAELKPMEEDGGDVAMNGVVAA